VIDLLHIFLGLLAIPPALASLYLLLTTLLSGRSTPTPVGVRRTKFDIIVPAHNEASVIARTVTSLRRVDWPQNLFRILTVADNCTDETAAVARAAGSLVLERHAETLRGKGYALEFAFSASLQEGWADAVVVIDADAEVSANLLEAFAAAIERGALAVQAHYGVLNPNASWRTRLMTIAKGSFHIVRSRARERMRVSCGIRGNGWCVTHGLLRAVPYRAFSLAEDLEFGIELGLAGYRVAYADEAHADADMVSGQQIAGKQRQRWESGRFQLIRSKTGKLLRASVQQRSWICLDLAVDLLVLPLSYIVLNVVLLAATAALVQIWLPEARVWLWVAAGCAGCLSAYVLRGWRLSGIGPGGILDLARAPAFLAWKLILMMRRESSEWVRTERERP
jgi:1,2-diacylglycerol 3-beta-glucosyltransferase